MSDVSDMPKLEKPLAFYHPANPTWGSVNRRCTLPLPGSLNVGCLAPENTFWDKLYNAVDDAAAPEDLLYDSDSTQPLVWSEEDEAPPPPPPPSLNDKAVINVKIVAAVPQNLYKTVYRYVFK
jgi:hypothetical protein